MGIVISAPDLVELDQTIEHFIRYAQFFEAEGHPHSFNVEQLEEIKQAVADSRDEILGVAAEFGDAATKDIKYKEPLVDTNGTIQVQFSGNLQDDPWMDMCRYHGMVPELKNDGSHPEGYPLFVHSSGKQADSSLRQAQMIAHYLKTDTDFSVIETKRADWEGQRGVHPLTQKYIEQFEAQQPDLAANVIA